MIDSIKVWYSCSDHDSTLGPVADESLNSLTMDLHSYFVLKYYGVHTLSPSTDARVNAASEEHETLEKVLLAC